MSIQANIPIDVVHLLPVLDKKLNELLISLSPQDWQKKTIAKLWTVKDVVAHLLDGNIRTLSILRDEYTGEQSSINSNQDLIDFLNKLNADWVQSMKRVSPQMLIVLHRATGELFCNYFKTINPFEISKFAVDWAGESESKNWMEIAREYTEKWLHQQQIRDAVNKPALLTRELFYPFINIFMLALPHTYRHVTAENGTVVKITVTSEIGGSWYLQRMEEKWVLTNDCSNNATTEIIIDPETSWKLFSKSLRPTQIINNVTILGDQKLGEIALSMVAVMA